MRQRFILFSACAAAASVAFLLQAPVAGQTTAAPRTSPAKTGASYTAPRTPWGDPDLQGTYTNKDESGIPFERPAEFEGKTLDQVTPAELAKVVAQRNEQKVESAPGVGGVETGAGPTHWYENYNAKNSRAWLVVDPPDGHIPPLTAEGRYRALAHRVARRGGNGFSVGPFDGPEDLSLYDRCITRGVPGSMMPAIYGNSYQIVQGPGWVAIRYEMVHESRMIPLDNRPHVSPKIEEWMGDARGHFDGDTLVVETTNFKEASAYRDASTHLKLTERFKPIDAKHVDWSVTVDDPHTWTRPWTFAMQLTRDASQPVFEYACHEGNYGLRDILSAERKAEREGKPSPTAGNNPRDTEE